MRRTTTATTGRSRDSAGKAQNKSLLLFSGEAYNVEMGITNEMFQSEREKFAFFMRFLAPPRPSPNTPGGAESIGRGRTTFGAVGCALCHTPTLYTGAATWKR